MSSSSTNDYPEWTSIANKRKRNITSSSSHSVVEAVVGQPSLKKDKKGSHQQQRLLLSSSFNENEVKINWAERKSCLETYPNDALIEPLMHKAIGVFMDLAQEFSRNNSETGPSMLWHLLPSVMEAIKSTPWSWFMIGDDIEEGYRLIMFVNYTYGDRGQDLTINQKKFRMVIMGKLKSKLSILLRDQMGTEKVEIVYAKKFFDGQ